MRMEELFEYAVAIRRQIHQYPEVGFELPKTAALVTEELKKMGYAPTSQYGNCSVVVDVGQGEEFVAVRADMDALPVQEKVDIPFKSRIDGVMHACGHDSHTAVLLAVAKYLKENEGKLTRRVRLLFQPAEESATSGAKMMQEHGVMEGITEVVCTHCDNTIPCGELRICPGDYMAACIPWSVTFHGKTAHAAFQQDGIDALQMGVEAYSAMARAVAEEAGENTPYIWLTGRLSGGTAHNVVPDSCQMDISFRFYDMDFAKRVETRCREICQGIAAKHGGSCDIDWHISTVAVYNDPERITVFEQVAKDAGLTVGNVPPRMSSEDFGWLLQETPGFIYRFGTRNEATGCTDTAHKNTFKIDEEGMRSAIRAWIAYLTR